MKEESYFSVKEAFELFGADVYLKEPIYQEFEGKKLEMFEVGKKGYVLMVIKEEEGIELGVLMDGRGGNDFKQFNRDEFNHYFGVTYLTKDAKVVNKTWFGHSQKKSGMEDNQVNA